MASGNVYYARHEGVDVLKYKGDIRYTIGALARLGELLDRLFAEPDCTDFLIDLSEAENIDSTNLGLLAKIARFTIDKYDRKATLLSTQPDIDRILEAVGFDQVFTILHEARPTHAPLESIGDAQEEGTEVLADLILEAHRALAAINEKNRDSFKSVIEVLEAETKPRRSE